MSLILVMVFAAVAAVATGCHPKMSVGYDTTASVTGPLANLTAIPRLEGVPGIDASTPPEGRNYSVGVGFGDRRLMLGVGLAANNISKSSLAIDGAKYMSASASLDARYNWLRYKGVAVNTRLAPTRTLLVDSTSGQRSWGSGLRYGGGVSATVRMFSVFADAYQERIIFFDGPAAGDSTRTGVTVGVAFQP